MGIFSSPGTFGTEPGLFGRPSGPLGFLHQFSAEQITLVTILAYLLFYTSHDGHGLRPGSLVPLFTFNQPRLSIIAFNRVFALTGLTLLAFVALGLFSPGLRLTRYATILLWIHWFLSVWHYYGFDLNRVVFRNPKRTSILFGLAGQAVLLGLYFGRLGAGEGIALAVILGTIHYYTMESYGGDIGGDLRNRPFAYLPLLLGVAFLAKEFYYRVLV